MDHFYFSSLTHLAAANEVKNFREVSVVYDGNLRAHSKDQSYAPWAVIESELQILKPFSLHLAEKGASVLAVSLMFMSRLLKQSVNVRNQRNKFSKSFLKTYEVSTVVYVTLRTTKRTSRREKDGRRGLRARNTRLTSKYALACTAALKRGNKRKRAELETTFFHGRADVCGPHAKGHSLYFLAALFFFPSFSAETKCHGGRGSGGGGGGNCIFSA